MYTTEEILMLCWYAGFDRSHSVRLGLLAHIRAHLLAGVIQGTIGPQWQQIAWLYRSGLAAGAPYHHGRLLLLLFQVSQ